MSLILRAAPEFGPPHARRFAIRNLGSGDYWTGEDFSPDWTHACLYATPSAACFEMQDIMRCLYDEKPLKRYRVPIELEVYGDVSMTQLARWMYQASFLNVRTHQYGNGPRDSLVLPVVHWGLIEEIPRPIFSLENLDGEEDGQ